MMLRASYRRVTDDGKCDVPSNCLSPGTRGGGCLLGMWGWHVVKWLSFGPALARTSFCSESEKRVFLLSIYLPHNH